MHQRKALWSLTSVSLCRHKKYLTKLPLHGLMRQSCVMHKLISKLLLLLHSQMKSIKVNGKCDLMDIYPFAVSVRMGDTDTDKCEQNKE